MTKRIKSWIFNIKQYFKSEDYRISDIIIDYMYFYAFEEVVTHWYSRTNDIYIGPGSPEGWDIKKSENKVRGINRIELLTSDGRIFRDLGKRFDNLKIDRTFKFNEILKNQIFKLEARGYIAKHHGLKGYHYLTQKGINHYLNGHSLEDKFVNRRNSLISIFISVFAVIISILLNFVNE